MCERSQFNFVLKAREKIIAKKDNSKSFLVGVIRTPTLRERISKTELEEMGKSWGTQYREIELLVPKYSSKTNNNAYNHIEETLFFVMRSLNRSIDDNITHGIVELKKKLEESKNLYLAYSMVNIPWSMMSNKLKVLDARGCNISSAILGEHFVKLANLEQLVLSSNGLSTLPPTIANLKRLRSLDISRNKITCINFFNLNSLFKLDASFNGIERFDLWLASLEHIDLMANEITSIPDSIDEICPKLRKLNLSYNLLTALPSRMGFMISLSDLHVIGNSFSKFPAEVISRGAGAILNYLRGNFPSIFLHQLFLIFRNKKASYGGNSGEETQVSRVRAMAVSLPRATKEVKDYVWPKVKLNFVGPQSSGKSCILSKLKGEKPRQLPTAGIEVKNWLFENINYTLFDFGGDVRYYPIYSYFMTPLSIYVLCFKIDEERSKKEKEDYIDHEQIVYWLRAITTFAKDSPIILVCTHSDLLSNQEKVYDDIYNRYIYPESPYRIHALQFVSSKKSKGILNLKKAIFAITNLYKYNEIRVPKSWEALEKDLGLIIRLSGRKVITYEEYDQLVGQHVSSKDFQEVTSFFHNVGILLHFKDDPKLRDVISNNFHSLFCFDFGSYLLCYSSHKSFLAFSRYG